MAIDFPNTPTVGQIFVQGGTSWTWDGVKWSAVTVAGWTDAPVDGATYGRKNASWSSVDAMLAPANAALNNVGRNLIHNPLFNVAQRGAGPFTTTGYTADRWNLYFNLDTTSAAINPIAAIGALPGDEEPRSVFFCNVTGNAAAAALTLLYQPIENVLRLSGKTVTVSFYASANLAGKKLGVSLDQNFGSGGSPSAAVQGTGQAVTLTTGWVRYSLTFTLPSAVGKTLGTNGDHYTSLSFWYSSGATNNTRAGGIGVQTAQINLWGVQLEIGSVATPLEKPDPQQDLAKCQRFYQVGLIQMNASASGGSQAFVVTNMLPVPMRGPPTFAVNGSLTLVNATAPAPFATSNSVIVYLNFASIAVGAVACVGPYTASADL